MKARKKFAHFENRCIIGNCRFRIASDLVLCGNHYRKLSPKLRHRFLVTRRGSLGERFRVDSEISEYFKLRLRKRDPVWFEAIYAESESK